MLKTSEILDALRTKDYEVRQNLAGLLFIHEILKLNWNIFHNVLLRKEEQEVSLCGHEHKELVMPCGRRVLPHSAAPYF